MTTMRNGILLFMMGLFALFPTYVISEQEDCLPNQEGGLGVYIYSNQPAGGHWEWVGSESQNSGDFYSVSGKYSYLYNIANVPGDAECLGYINMLNVNSGSPYDWVLREGECLTELTPGYTCCYHKPGADFVWVCDDSNVIRSFNLGPSCLVKYQ